MQVLRNDRGGRRDLALPSTASPACAGSTRTRDGFKVKSSFALSMEPSPQVSRSRALCLMMEMFCRPWL